MTTGADKLAMRLHPYQREVLGAISDSVFRRQGLTFTVEIARQGGKNETSACLELLMLCSHADRDVTAIKVAPTYKPQVIVSRERLRERAGR